MEEIGRIKDISFVILFSDINADNTYIECVENKIVLHDIKVKAMFL